MPHNDGELEDHDEDENEIDEEVEYEFTDISGYNLPPGVLKATRAAKADPKNDDAVLDLALELDQIGDSEHADFFRAVVEQHRPNLPPGEWRRHLARGMELSNAKHEEWFGRLSRRAGGWHSTQRGFPDVMCYDGDLVDEGDTGLGNLSTSRGWPWGGQLTVLHRSDFSGAEVVRRLLELPMLAEVFDLNLNLNKMDGPTATTLGKSKSVAHLRGLHLHQTNLSAPAVKALIESPVIKNLLSFSVFADGPGLAAVAAAEGLKAIRELRIRGDKLTPKDWIKLGNSPHLTEVRSLDVGETPLNAEGMAALASTPLMARVESLTIGGVADPDGAATSLAASPNAANLRELNCPRTYQFQMTSAGMIALAASPYLGNLRALDLSIAAVKADGIKALAKSKTLTGLERLLMRYNPLGAAGGKALAGSPVFARLTDLRLGNCNLGAAGGAAVANSPHLSGLRVLNLSGNGMTNTAVEGIVRPGAFDHLRALILGYNKIDDAGVEMLANADHFTDLGVLDLAGQGQTSVVSSRHGKLLTKSAIDTLIKSESLKELAALSLQGNAAALPRRADLAERFGKRVHCTHSPPEVAMHQ
ncbi:MAG: hypothetical protein C0467_23780 [Planctomycetaceae bacterium]|nr:hypothetical protein [Planctomycetaceae bacterium]